MKLVFSPSCKPYVFHRFCSRFCKDYFIQHNQMSKATDIHINNRAQITAQCLPCNARVGSCPNLLIPPLFTVFVGHFDTRKMKKSAKSI